jgi:DNA-nicking Smr family endonuclease
MSRPPKPADQDQTLWERVKQTIAPLPVRKAPGPVTKTPAPLPGKPAFELSENRAPARPVKPQAGAKRVGMEDLSAHKRIRRGRVEPQARIDLHGMRHDDARAYLLGGLSAHAADRLHCVLVITGRGERDAGVLRTGLPRWMNEPEFRVLASGFAPAHLRHGGKGAWYVFLRKQNT